MVKIGGKISLLALTMLATMASPAIAATPAPQRAGYIDANGVSLRYRVDGKGPVIVLLHEIGMAIEGWDEVVPSLTSTHTVIRYDLRGFGLSQKVRGTVTIDDETADLRGVLDTLNVKGPVTLVGAALGASVAASFAATYPERVRGLYLLSPVINLPSDPATPSNIPASRSATGPIGPSPNEILEKQGVRAYLAAQEEALYPARTRTPERYARFRGIQLASDPIGRAATVRMVSSANIAALLPRLNMPTQVVATTFFPLQPPQRIQRVAALLPNGHFEAMDAGHLAALAQPDLVAASIKRFLRTIGG